MICHCQYTSTWWNSAKFLCLIITSKIPAVWAMNLLHKNRAQTSCAGTISFLFARCRYLTTLRFCQLFGRIGGDRWGGHGGAHCRGPWRLTAGPAGAASVQHRRRQKGWHAQDPSIISWLHYYCYLHNRRWGGCVYVLQMFLSVFVFFCFFSVRQKIPDNPRTDFHETFTKRYRGKWSFQRHATAWRMTQNYFMLVRYCTAVALKRYEGVNAFN